RRDRRIAGGERTQLLLVVGFDHAEAPRSAAVEHRTEDHHLTSIDERLPVARVAAHDLPLLVRHVVGEVRSWSLEPEDERGDTGTPPGAGWGPEQTPPFRSPAVPGRPRFTASVVSTP